VISAIVTTKPAPGIGSRSSPSIVTKIVQQIQTVTKIGATKTSPRRK
jgi:hypothetical protein